MVQENTHPTRRPDISVVVPMLNEQDNIAELYRELVEVLDQSGLTWEAIFVDDGSRDQSVGRLLEAARNDPRITIVELSRTFGQTAAMAAAIKRSVGRFIVPIDADLQNDPRDIPRMVNRLIEDDQIDVVSGWRKNRQDKFLTRRLPSQIANRIIGRVTWTSLHDFGCSLKAYRSEILKDIELYGEMHRFLPALCKWRGARIVEEVVNHRPRKFGKSKYGLKRSIKVLLDLITVKFLGDYLAKPLYFFGKVGLFSLVISLLSLTVAIVQRFGYLTMTGGPLNLNRNVLVQFSAMAFIVFVMFIMMGVMSELMVRTYLEGTGKTPYRIRRIMNAADRDARSAAIASTPEAGRLAAGARDAG